MSIGESTSDQSPKGSTSEGPNDSESSGGALTFLARFVRVVLDVVNWLVRFLLALVTWFFVLLIRVLDIHINKIILLVVLIVSLEEVSDVSSISGCTQTLEMLFNFWGQCWKNGVCIGLERKGYYFTLPLYFLFKF